MSYLLALDQGTTSSRSVLFDARGSVVAIAQREIRQHYRYPGWVEHDPVEIWESQLQTARQVLATAQVSAAQVRAIGITNQRETTLLWDRRTGEPVYPAIVWQDRRTEAACERLREGDLAVQIAEKTGLRIDPYFSATKLQWLLDEVSGVRARAERGELAFGTVDCWLLWKLSGGTAHATDVSNASRTMLFDVERSAWDSELLDRFQIPAAVLPQVLPSVAAFGRTQADWLGGTIPVCGIAGDQQSALFGQACFCPGMAKNTYGTGCFMLMHTGEERHRSDNGLITTRAAQSGATAEFALEGSVFIGGAVVQWLRDGLGLIERSGDIEALAASVPDSGGVMVVPAFTGLGAPYWDLQARGVISGLTRGTTRAHLARAALESIAFQSASVLQAMARDAQARGAARLLELRVDGGACVNDLLMQVQADLLGIPVLRPRVSETTALGAAYLAGLGSGLYASRDELGTLWQLERRFEPAMPQALAIERLAQWERAVRQATAR